MRCFVAIFLSLFFSTAAVADCIGFLSPEDHIAQSDSVFIGIAKKTIPLEGPVGWEYGPDHSTNFIVVELLKGDANADVISILHNMRDRSPLGADFIPEERYEIFASKMKDGPLFTSDCLLAMGFRKLKGWTWNDYRQAVGN